jgi:hypothetical protein
MKSLNSNYVLKGYIRGETSCLHLEVIVRRDNKHKSKGTLRWYVNAYPDAVGTENNSTMEKITWLFSHFD